ncbi:hypothetical protein BX600DRAFT_475705 [Xylariales sp. PMI_506]|nr:hypothetical protein BX600DRAFT_475705 [Xylariales sp. PMI_506]
MTSTPTSTPTSTLVGPLTTTFTPPSTCNINVYNTVSTAEVCGPSSNVHACQYYQLGDQASTSVCLPSGWDPLSVAYFSPGICPDGYTTACSSTVSTSGTVETHATCCPTGYLCQTSVEFDWYSTDICYWPVPSTVTFVYTQDVIGVGPETITATGGGLAAINAYGVNIRWKAADFVSTTTSTSLSSTGLTTTSASTSQQETGTSRLGGGDELSTGAKAGIGVASAVIGILIIIAGAILYRRKVSRSLTSSPQQATPLDNVHPDQSKSTSQVAEIDGQHGGMYHQQPPYGQHGVWPPVYSVPAELPVPRSVHEM